MILQGVTLSGVTVSIGGGGGGLGFITYDQMPPPITGEDLQDPNAIVNGSVGFTITASNLTGMAVRNLTAENVAYYNSLGPGPQTFILGPGSTYSTITGNIVQTPQTGMGFLVIMFDSNVSYPATFNWPIGISGE